MSTLTLSRDLTVTDSGTGNWVITATDSDGQSAAITIAYTISPAIAPVFSGWPNTVSLLDSATAGTVVASGTITNSDGSAFSGAVTAINQTTGAAAPLTFTP